MTTRYLRNADGYLVRNPNWSGPILSETERLELKNKIREDKLRSAEQRAELEQLLNDMNVITQEFQVQHNLPVEAAASSIQVQEQEQNMLEMSVELSNDEDENMQRIDELIKRCQNRLDEMQEIIERIQ